MSGYVLDASVAVTALTEPGSQAAGLLAGNDAAFRVPSIFDAEVLSALRGLVRGGKFDSAAAADLVADLMVLPVDRWHMSPLLPRMWELRGNHTLRCRLRGPGRANRGHPRHRRRAHHRRARNTLRDSDHEVGESASPEV
jgi:predicted nucleic acid-binding protein